MFYNRENLANNDIGRIFNLKREIEIFDTRLGLEYPQVSKGSER